MPGRISVHSGLGLRLAAVGGAVAAGSALGGPAFAALAQTAGLQAAPWLTASVAAVVAAVPAAIYLSRVGAALSGIAKAAAAAGRGDPMSVPGVERTDDIGLLARSLAGVQAGDIDDMRVRLALDGCPTNVMIVDENNIIRFMNLAVSRLFHEHVADFKAAVPSFMPDEIIGQSMGIFHRNPAHQERMVSQLSNTHVSRVKVGRRTFDLAVSPVNDASGRRLGAMLEWRDMTVELAAQSEVAAVAQAAAEGDFSGRVPLEGKAGFMRDLAAAMNAIGQGVDQATTEMAAAMNALAQGDLTRTVLTDYKGRFAELKDALNETVERLSETVGTIQTTAEDVSSAAREIASGANDLSSRTEQQASSLEETAATTEELAASVKASAQSSRQAVELADQAMAVASDGGGIVRDAVEAMARIEQASQKISDITGVIDEIAFQTNLLALNAAVEAARAGDAGKGFAVVASEVRTLAQRSSEAAKDITALINASGAEVAQGVKLVRGAGEALEKIVQASQKVSSTVGEISAASGEQANGIDEMSQAVAHMDEMTQQNAALAEQSAASAGSLTTQIQKLEELVGGFRTRGGRAARRAEMRPAAGQPAPTTEPDRLRTLAADAFEGRKAPARQAPAHTVSSRPPRRAAIGGSTGGWDEF